MKVPAFEKMKVFGAVICVDAATVHGEPLVNCARVKPIVMQHLTKNFGDVTLFNKII